MFTALLQYFPTPQASAWFYDLSAFPILSLTSSLQNAWHEILGQRPKSSDMPVRILCPYVAICRLIRVSAEAWFKARSFLHGASRHYKIKPGEASWPRPRCQRCRRTAGDAGPGAGSLDRRPQPLPTPPLEGVSGPVFPRKKREPTAGSTEPRLHFGSGRKGKRLGAGYRAGRRLARWFGTRSNWVGTA